MYKNLKESPEKLEFQITENREDSETPTEKNTNTNQTPEITEVPELSKPKRGKALKRKVAHKEETNRAFTQDQKITYQRIKNKSKKRSRFCIQN